MRGASPAKIEGGMSGCSLPEWATGHTNPRTSALYAGAGGGVPSTAFDRHSGLGSSGPPPCWRDAPRPPPVRMRRPLFAHCPRLWPLNEADPLFSGGAEPIGLRYASVSSYGCAITHRDRFRTLTDASRPIS